MRSYVAGLETPDRLRLSGLVVHVLAALPTLGGAAAVVVGDPSVWIGFAFAFFVVVWLLGAAVHALAVLWAGRYDPSTRAKRIERAVGTTALGTTAILAAVIWSPVPGGSVPVLDLLTMLSVLALPAATVAALRSTHGGGAGGNGPLDADPAA